jgi:S1-C subfamily serine protease
MLSRELRVEVIWQDRMYSAKVIFKDESTDAAILKIKGSGFACLPLVSSATVKTGDPVFTVGFPQVSIQGAEAKFTEGSISSLSGMGNSPRFFQISVPIQPGNSGGPLVNDKGEVIGLVLSRLDDIEALLATGTVPQGVNYALKSSFVVPLVDSIPDLAQQLAESSRAKDRSGAIDRAKEAVLLIVGFNGVGETRGPILNIHSAEDP